MSSSAKKLTAVAEDLKLELQERLLIAEYDLGKHLKEQSELSKTVQNLTENLSSHSKSLQKLKADHESLHEEAVKLHQEIDSSHREIIKLRLEKESVEKALAATNQELESIKNSRLYSILAVIRRAFLKR